MFFKNRNYHHKMIYNCDSADLFRLENTKYSYFKKNYNSKIIDNDDLSKLHQLATYKSFSCKVK